MPSGLWITTPSLVAKESKPALGKRLGFSKTHRGKTHAPKLPHQPDSESTEVPNFFAKIPSQQRKSAIRYHFRRSQQQDTTLGSEEFRFSLSQATYLDLLSHDV